MRQTNRGGFTLVELMVVALIVAVLAAVAIPLMSANKRRAMSTEADAALGTVRSALRTMYAETGAYNKDLNGNTLTAPLNPTALPLVHPGDLNGKYFSDGNYSITAISSNAYTLTATGTGDVSGVVVTLTDGGAFTRTGL